MSARRLWRRATGPGARAARAAACFLLLAAAGRAPAQEAGGPPPDPTLAERLCADCRAVETFSCTLEKTTEADGRTETARSRVHYGGPGRLHVETTAPVPGRTIADGARLYHVHKGAAKGFSRPLADLPEDWAAIIHNVPGSPMEFLLRLAGAPETELPPTPAFPLRRGYMATHRFVTLSCDPEGRLALIEFFDSPQMERRTGRVAYADFVRAGGCWIACRQEQVMTTPRGEARVVRRIRRPAVNRPIDKRLFDPAEFFAGIEFAEEPPAGTP